MAERFFLSFQLSVLIFMGTLNSYKLLVHCAGVYLKLKYKKVHLEEKKIIKLSNSDRRRYKLVFVRSSLAGNSRYGQ